MDIALVGGGIGGLTAAACLLRDGHRVRIYEQAPHVGEIGAAVQMSANAVKVLYHLGLKDRLEAQAVKPTAFEFRRFDSGELLHEIKLGEDHAQRHGHPYYQIHRVDLHAALLEVVEQLDPQALQLGYRAIEVQEDEHSASIVFEDGRQVRASLVIGSDGIKSVVRISLTEQQPPTTWSKSNAREYGFYSNVNPAVDHPRWTQARERRLPGTLFNPNWRDTLAFNGYAREVAGLYRGMDLNRYF